MTEPEEGKFDDSLFEILKECKSPPLFLDVVFGFLKRRSDFYVVSDHKESPIGLPLNVAESMVRHHFLKWKNMDNKREEKKKVKANKAPTEEQKLKKEIEELICVKDTSRSDSYNGAVQKNYVWSQTITDLDLIVTVPYNISAKQLQVHIEPESIFIKNKSNDETILQGKMPHKVKHQEVIWSLDKRKLSIHLDKTNEFWWSQFLTTETPLDVSKLDCSKPFDDLSEEAKAKIEELQWNQERKRQGLMTSVQRDLQDKLKKAWNVEGSPFEGPFDPDSVKIT